MFEKKKERRKKILNNASLYFSKAFSSLFTNKLINYTYKYKFDGLSIHTNII